MHGALDDFRAEVKLEPFVAEEGRDVALLVVNDEVLILRVRMGDLRHEGRKWESLDAGCANHL